MREKPAVFAQVQPDGAVTLMFEFPSDWTDTQIADTMTLFKESIQHSYKKMSGGDSLEIKEVT